MANADSITTLSQPAKPIKASRIQVVDALRGFALFGILFVHCARWFSAWSLPDSLYETHAGGPVNDLLEATVESLFANKFYGYFSFLFGLSFALMMSRSQESTQTFYRRFMRRLVVLGGIGLIHYMHWRGDILFIYAVLGFILLLFSRASNTVVVVTAILFVVNLPGRLTYVYQTWVTPLTAFARQQEADAHVQKVQAYYHLLTEGSYLDNVLARAEAVRDIVAFQFDSGRIYITLGFFLFGLYAGRRQLFANLTRKRALFGKFALYMVLALLVIKVSTVTLTALYGNNQQTPVFPKTLLLTIYDLRAAVLTFFYISGLTLLFQARLGRWAVRPLASVGKMALTNYLLQTIIGTLLFFGYGLGLLGTIDMWTAALLTLPIFLIQILFSMFWLAYFRYGPIEWLWRSLTYGQWQPIRIG